MNPRSATAIPFSSARRALSVAGWCLACLVVASGAVMRFRIAPVPLSDPDTWGYIHPAIALAGGHGFLQASGRDWLYPAFVWAGLKATGSFSGLALIQQTLGVLSGVVFWLVLRSWLALLPACLIAEAGMAVLGPAALALYLLNPRTLFMELSLRPESVFCIVGFAQLWCVTGYIRARWKDHNSAAAFAAGIGACVLAYACMLLKPSWAFAAAFTTLPVVAGIFGQGIARWARWGALPAAAVLSLAVLWLPAKLVYVRDSAAGTFLPVTLFTIHAREILAEMERQDASLPAGDTEKAFLDDFLPVFRAEFAKSEVSTGVYAHLGYDPDYLMYQSPMLSWIRARLHLTEEQLAPFCRGWYLKALAGDPAAIARKAGGQLSYFFTGDSSVFFGKTQVLDWDYGVSASSLPAIPDPPSSWVGQVYGRYLDGVKSATSGHACLYSLPGVYEASKATFARVWLIDVVFLVVLLGCLVWPEGRDLRLAGMGSLVLFCAPFGNALTVSIIHALDMNRYRYTYSGFLILAFAAMAVFCLSVVARLICRRRS